jgi:hypothetical protein
MPNAMTATSTTAISGWAQFHARFLFQPGEARRQHSRIVSRANEMIADGGHVYWGGGHFIFSTRQQWWHFYKRYGKAAAEAFRAGEWDYVAANLPNTQRVLVGCENEPISWTDVAYDGVSAREWYRDWVIPTMRAKLPGHTLALNFGGSFKAIDNFKNDAAFPLPLDGNMLGAVHTYPSTGTSRTWDTEAQHIAEWPLVAAAATARGFAGFIVGEFGASKLLGDADRTNRYRWARQHIAANGGWCCMWGANNDYDGEPYSMAGYGTSATWSPDTPSNFWGPRLGVRGLFDLAEPSGSVATARLLFYARPRVSILPELASVEWLAGFNMRDPAAYGGSLPSDGASVTNLLAMGGFPYAAIQDGANAVPTFRANALGTGRHGLRFDAASLQYLSLGGLFTPFNITDATFVYACCYRHKGTGNPQNVFGFNRSSGTSQNFGHLYTSTAPQYRTNGQVGASTPAQVTLTINTTDTIAAVGSHGRANSTNRANRISLFRNGGSRLDNNSSAGTIETATWTNTNALDVALLGARRNSGGVGNYFDGDIGLLAIGRLRTGVDVITTADETALLDFTKAFGGVA